MCAASHVANRKRLFRPVRYVKRRSSSYLSRISYLCGPPLRAYHERFGKLRQRHICPSPALATLGSCTSVSRLGVVSLSSCSARQSITHPSSSTLWFTACDRWVRLVNMRACIYFGVGNLITRREHRCSAEKTIASVSCSRGGDVAVACSTNLEGEDGGILSAESPMPSLLHVFESLSEPTSRCLHCIICPCVATSHQNTRGCMRG